MKLVLYYFTIPFWRAEVTRLALFIGDIPFTDYKLRNTAVFNIVRAKTLEGTDIWFNKIDPSTNEKFLRSLESNDYIEYLIENCNPKYER